MQDAMAAPVIPLRGINHKFKAMLINKEQEVVRRCICGFPVLKKYCIET
jgi:hypothetical protein